MNTHPIWNLVYSIVSRICLSVVNCVLILLLIISIVFKPYELSIYPTCIVCKQLGNCVRLYVSIVFNYRLLCTSYMVSYGDLVSIIYLIVYQDYYTTVRNSINNKNNQPYHIKYSANLTVLITILNNASNIPLLYTIMEYSQEFERISIV